MLGADNYIETDTVDSLRSTIHNVSRIENGTAWTAGQKFLYSGFTHNFQTGLIN